MPNRPLQRMSSLSQVVQKANGAAGTTLQILPDAAKLIFRGRPEKIEAAGAAFGIGFPQTACRFVSKGGRAVCWLGPDEWMLQAVGEDPAAIAGGLDKALSGTGNYSIVDVSHRSDAFSVSGPEVAYLLNHGCPLDLSVEEFPVGMCTRTIFDRAAIFLSRPGPTVFHVDVWRSFAPYVWEMLVEAQRELV